MRHLLFCTVAIGAVNLSCADNPDQPECCPMEDGFSGPHECLFKNFIGGSQNKFCPPSCERKFKSLMEACECDKHFKLHFQWRNAKSLCDPKGIYVCTAESAVASTTNPQSQNAEDADKQTEAPVEAGIDPTIPVASAGCFLVAAGVCAFFVLKNKRSRGTSPLPSFAPTYRSVYEK